MEEKVVYNRTCHSTETYRMTKIFPIRPILVLIDLSHLSFLGNNISHCQKVTTWSENNVKA